MTNTVNPVSVAIAKASDAPEPQFVAMPAAPSPTVDGNGNLGPPTPTNAFG